MSDVTLLEVASTGFLEINGVETLTVDVGERHIEIVDVASMGPPGPTGPEPQVNADLVAYFILANS